MSGPPSESADFEDFDRESDVALARRLLHDVLDPRSTGITALEGIYAARVLIEEDVQLRLAAMAIAEQYVTVETPSVFSSPAEMVIAEPIVGMSRLLQGEKVRSPGELAFGDKIRAFGGDSPALAVFLEADDPGESMAAFRAVSQTFPTQVSSWPLSWFAEGRVLRGWDG